MSHLLAFEFAVLAGDRERCWVNVCSASPPSVLSTLRSLLTPYVCTTVYVTDLFNVSMFGFN